MAGAYCAFCDSRCFVLRELPDGRRLHLATCERGAAYDHEKTGYDFRTARNPHAPASVTDTERAILDAGMGSYKAYVEELRRIEGHL